MGRCTMTYREILNLLEIQGNKLAVYAMDRIRWIASEQTGKWQAWDDMAPDWVQELAICSLT